MLYHHDYELDTTRRDAPIRITARGRAVLANPMTNRATAFTVQERRYLGLVGLMPSGVTGLGNQVRRVYAQYQSARRRSRSTTTWPTCATATRSCSTGCWLTTSKR